MLTQVQPDFLTLLQGCVFTPQHAELLKEMIDARIRFHNPNLASPQALEHDALLKEMDAHKHSHVKSIKPIRTEADIYIATHDHGHAEPHDHRVFHKDDHYELEDGSVLVVCSPQMVNCLG